MMTTIAVEGLRVHHSPKVAFTSTCFAIPNARYVKAEEEGPEYRWMVVRHPLDRLVSCWAFFCQSEDKTRLGSQHSLISAGCYRGMPFDEFLDAILSNPAVNMHTMAQVRFAGPHKFDRICRLVNLQAEWAALRKMFPCLTAIDVRNRSIHDEWESYYTPAHRQRAERVYAADMALFEASDPNPPQEKDRETDPETVTQRDRHGVYRV